MSSVKEMTSKNRKKPSGLHPRNPHHASYDLGALCKAVPELSAYVIQTPRGRDSIDFADPSAVKYLNQALLKTGYGMDIWDIPPGYLCPPVPGRADYIHYIADLLAEDCEGAVPRGRHVRALDIGVGANCIYPIIGSQEYGWRFVGTELDSLALNAAKNLVKFNKCLKGKVQLRAQQDASNIFQGVISPEDLFDITLCNPPFHASANEAAAGSKRKVRNLNKGSSEKKTAVGTLNFGGQSNELWCDGGEQSFIRKMIAESAAYADQCLWFSTLVSKKDNLVPLKKALKNQHAATVKVIEMSQGNKISRILAWSFMNKKQRQQWRNERDPSKQ